MKKRIGTKLYDTETAICIIPEINLYRTQRKQTYFFFDGNAITPVDYNEAENILNAHGLSELLNHKPSIKGQAKINISAAHADVLAAYCRQHSVTQKQVIEEYIETLRDK